ncbi:TrmB family transcriptional regulator [bacterium]|nr:TrmB family transcriptional regulator [bacterium]
MSQTLAVEAFEQLGLSRLEAEIYVHLLENPPSTGYRIAKAIGRSKTNVYQAIEGLAAKGAILVSEGELRLCTAVSPEELLDQMERGFQDRKKLALDEVSSLIKPRMGDGGIYRLASMDQVYERARRMLRGCEQTAYLDIYPGPFERLRPALEEALDRGINVFAEVYEPTELEGAIVIDRASLPSLWTDWPVDALVLFVDGREHLIAFMERGGGRVHDAFWSDSVLLSWAYGIYILSDLALAGITKKLADGDCPPEELRAYMKSLSRRLGSATLPGYGDLNETFGWGIPRKDVE